MSVRESVLATVALLLPACVSNPDPPPNATAQTGAQAVAAVRELHQQDQAASLSGDAEALMALWSTDPIALPPEGPILLGRDRMAENLRQMLSDSSWETVEYVQEFLEIEVVGDYAWDLGTFRGRVRNRADGTEMASAGKLLRILMRSENGAWKVHRSMWVEEPPAQADDGYPGTDPVPAATGSADESGQASAVGQADDFLVTEPEWSRDGEWLVFAGGVWPDLDVFVVAAAGSEARRLFGGDSTEYMPSWSPDGRRIVFASTRSGSHDLYIGPYQGGQVFRLTADTACDNTEPRWSPTGEWIAYRSNCDGNREVYRIRPDGTDRQRLTMEAEEDGEPSWSPDGRRMVFTSGRDGQPEVYVMDADGSNQTRITETPGGHSRRADWSPDGEWIAFGTNRDGNDEVYVMHPDGSGARNVSTHPAREYYSRWSPDGRRLAFTSNRDRQRNAIYSMYLDGTDVRRLFPR